MNYYTESYAHEYAKGKQERVTVFTEAAKVRIKLDWGTKLRGTTWAGP